MKFRDVVLTPNQKDLMKNGLCIICGKFASAVGSLYCLYYDAKDGECKTDVDDELVP